MTRECTITIWGEDDLTQDVRCVYEIVSKDGYFEPEWFVITSCKILDPIVIEPTDLDSDVKDQIQFNEGFSSCVVRMDCEVEKVITAEKQFKLIAI